MRSSEILLYTQLNFTLADFGVWWRGGEMEEGIRGIGASLESSAGS